MSRKDLLDFLNERGFEDTILLEGEDLLLDSLMKDTLSIVMILW